MVEGLEFSIDADDDEEYGGGPPTLEGPSRDAAAVVQALEQLTFVVESHAGALIRIAELLEHANAASAEASSAARELANALASAVRELADS
ncbi:hypothetical protein LCGC14_0798580 [marine sediment metagenome]|uniref:Uncharacterized protein n=1 Tax=marine sediment metagenome TaxID=412755 RepID=A0A0F9PQ91_9ZZZZ